jgi:hypothetical protein
MMIENAVKSYIDKFNITVIILKEHDEKYEAKRKLTEAFGDSVNIVVLENETSGPAETVYQGLLRSSRISKDSPILIKDCDGFYESKNENGNVIYVAKLSKHPKIRTASAKSFTITNNQGIVTTVVEKKIVSDNFCVGGYQFESANTFMKAYESIQVSGEIFVSHIIDYLINHDNIFVESEVENFVDVGVLEDWRDYNNKPTYFCDIDGTIVKSKFNYLSGVEPIQSNIDVLLKELDRGCKIIFVTSRPKKYESITREMLDALGFYGCQLITEVHHSKRILINDFANTNPYPTAQAINIKRDDDNLKDYI